MGGRCAWSKAAANKLPQGGAAMYLYRRRWGLPSATTVNIDLCFVEDPVGMAILIDIGHTALGLDEHTVIFHTIFIQQGFYDLVIHVVQVGDAVNQSVGVFSLHEITFFHL
jgi:hypothetical protein